MDDMELIAQKRAIPSRGRARINSEDLARLGVEEGALAEIGVRGGPVLPVAIFADYLVEPGTIRVGGEDLEKLGVGPGTKLIIRKKPPLMEQLKQAVKRASGEHPAGIEQVAKTPAQVITSPEKNDSPGLYKAGKAVGPEVKADSGVAAEGPGITIESVADLVESAKKQLRQGDAILLERLLRMQKGSIATVTVPAGTPLRKIRQLAIPPGVDVIAVQRGDSVEVPGPAIVLLSGDKIFLAGDDELIGEAARAI